MITKADMPKSEAKVVTREFGTEDWRDALDFDPITLPTELDGCTDAFHGPLMTIVESLAEAEMESYGPGGSGPEFMLVWSATGHPVKAVCPVCDDVFVVSDGAPGDELNEGVDALWCGCDPKDSFNG